MSRNLRRLGVLVLAAMLLAAAAGDGQAQGRRRTTFDGLSVVANPVVQPQVRLGQAAYNIAVLGKALQRVPPYAFGVSPFGPAVVPSSTPALSTFSAGSPMLGFPSLSTSPYGSALGTAGLASDFSLSTVPGGSGYGGSSPYGGYYPPYTYIPPGAAALFGLASLTSASGQYWNQIGQAQLVREQSRQAEMETAKKRVEWERWYEEYGKPTAPKMRAKEMATDLERARNDPPATEVWSGKSLNDLLRSIQSIGALNRGPNLPLEEDTLKAINVSAGARGNVGMLRNDGNLNWPLSLTEAPFTDLRERLSKNIRHAVSDLKGKEPVPASTLKDITNDFKSLNDKLSDSADDLSPGQYIEAKRYLNQLAQAVRALSDQKAVNYFNQTWTARGKNVAELVANMTRDGLVFAPAAPGDEAAYTSLYQSLRAFEAGIQQSQK
jgi:hypothetical protein